MSKINSKIQILSVAHPKINCNFCKSGEVNPKKLGPLYRYKEFVLHYFCMVFSSGITQQGKFNEGILGFRIADIQADLYRCCRLKCVFCNKYGAATTCSCYGNQPLCRRHFHFPCGLKNRVPIRFMGQLIAGCDLHNKPYPRPEDVKRDSLWLWDYEPKDFTVLFRAYKKKISGQLKDIPSSIDQKCKKGCPPMLHIFGLCAENRAKYSDDRQRAGRIILPLTRTQHTKLFPLIPIIILNRVTHENVNEPFIPSATSALNLSVPLPSLNSPEKYSTSRFGSGPENLVLISPRLEPALSPRISLNNHLSPSAAQEFEIQRSQNIQIRNNKRKAVSASPLRKLRRIQSFSHIEVDSVLQQSVTTCLAVAPPLILGVSKMNKNLISQYDELVRSGILDEDISIPSPTLPDNFMEKDEEEDVDEYERNAEDGLISKADFRAPSTPPKQQKTSPKLYTNSLTARKTFEVKTDSHLISIHSNDSPDKSRLHRTRRVSSTPSPSSAGLIKIQPKQNAVGLNVISPTKHYAAMRGVISDDNQNEVIVMANLKNTQDHNDTSEQNSQEENNSPRKSNSSGKSFDMNAASSSLVKESTGSGNEIIQQNETEIDHVNIDEKEDDENAGGTEIIQQNGTEIYYVYIDEKEENTDGTKIVQQIAAEIDVNVDEEVDENAGGTEIIEQIEHQLDEMEEDGQDKAQCSEDLDSSPEEPPKFQFGFVGNSDVVPSGPMIFGMPGWERPLPDCLLGDPFCFTDLNEHIQWENLLKRFPIRY